MSTTAVYYPRIGQMSFYDAYGKIVGSFMGKSLARDKFYRLLKAGKMPRISLRKRVRITL